MHYIPAISNSFKFLFRNFLGVFYRNDLVCWGWYLNERAFFSLVICHTTSCLLPLNCLSVRSCIFHGMVVFSFSVTTFSLFLILFLFIRYSIVWEYLPLYVGPRLVGFLYIFLMRQSTQCQYCFISISKYSTYTCYNSFHYMSSVDSVGVAFRLLLQLYILQSML